jgi:hypothetical protein
MSLYNTYYIVPLGGFLQLYNMRQNNYTKCLFGDITDITPQEPIDFSFNGMKKPQTSHKV